ncbi:3-oxoacyl-ACP synthase [Thermoanaerobaculum aquaticum]|uniref:3-oxoacyl-[acyl-carrier-protein] synthase 2 n=1 Tax=Thermoanaerobaculum aquaticum TaxID=1312852 RepID=A0A062XQ16_9BACT|nr:beta-ketoacyl-ACP synthase II [Thermoanaerobaculum aquaticum]KDA54712.1 3-oxoacyl-ACP synthase [Thermoanaerobaculum aquaticum]BCW93005.1 MAG: 3-oxoacyl-[acyl-carrier-protein] synthase 2 [Thermoanaerobaculum sp.]
MPRRVVVTGVGLISPLGVGTEPTWEALIAGRSGVGAITKFDASTFPVRIAAEVKGFDPQVWLDAKEARKFDLFVQYALAASLMAVENSGLKITPDVADRVAVVLGSGIGGLPLIEENHRTLQEKGPRRVSPFFIPGAIINMCAGLVSIRLGAKGPNMATCTACSTSAHAITDAYLYIRHGYADAAIAGGAEAVIDPLAVAGFASMRALSTRNEEPEKASRPWDRDRDGFVMGEGAGVLVLEELEFALRRGAPILCEVLGIGMTGDAYHITAPCEDGDGAARVMAAALKDAGIAPEQVDYINAHGTSTPHGDRIETVAIKRVFGDHAYKLAVSSTKSATGHLLGAAGGLETGITALVVARDVIPPTLNLDNPDEGCDLDYVPHQARKQTVRVALSNSFGFGGTNACIVLGKWEA